MQRRIGDCLWPANAGLSQTLGDYRNALQVFEAKYPREARQRAHHDRTPCQFEQTTANLVEWSPCIDRKEITAHQGRQRCVEPHARRRCQNLLATERAHQILAIEHRKMRLRAPDQGVEDVAYLLLGCKHHRVRVADLPRA